MDEGWNAWQSTLIIIVISSIVGGLFVWSGALGAEYGFPFVIIARAAFGWRGSYLIALFRGLVSILIGALMIWMNAQLMTAFLTSWHIGYENLPLGFPNGWGIDSQLAISLSISWFTSVLPGVLGFGVITVMLAAKAILLPLFIVVMTIWAGASKSSSGPLLQSQPFGHDFPFQTTGEILEAVFTVVPYFVGLAIPFVMNVSDYTRHARSKFDAMLGHAVGTPLFTSAFAVLGMILTSIYFGAYGTISPLNLKHLMSQEGIPSNPGFTTVFGILFMFSSVCANVILNVYPLALITVLYFPRVPMRVAHVIAGLVIIPCLALFIGTTPPTEDAIIPAVVTPVYETLLAFLAPVFAVMLAHEHGTFHETFPDKFTRYIQNGGGIVNGWGWKAFLAVFVGSLVSLMGATFTWMFLVESVPMHPAKLIVNGTVSEAWKMGWNATNITLSTPFGQRNESSLLEVAWVWRRVGPVGSMVVAVAVFLLLSVFIKDDTEEYATLGDGDTSTQFETIELDNGRDSALTVVNPNVGHTDLGYESEANQLGI